MSEYSISSPGQELTVEHLPSGVVYAATEDLPAAAPAAATKNPPSRAPMRRSGNFSGIVGKM